MARLLTHEQHPACACAGVQTANPPDHFNASMAVSAVRHGLSDSLRSGTLASRDLAASEAAIGATSQLAEQVASMGLGKVRSETSHAHAESSTSSIGRRGADVFSRLSSIGKIRRPEKSASAYRNRTLPARRPPRFRHHERSAFTWTVQDDQRLRDLTIEQGPNHLPGITPAPNRPVKGLTVENAIAYLDKIKLKFHDRPEIYNQFLDIMKECQAQSIDTRCVIERVKQLFQGHRTLILGFNTFLPPEHQIEFSDDALVDVAVDQMCPQSFLPPGRKGVPPPLTFEQEQQAQSFVDKVKKTFEDEPGTVRAFLEILQTYTKEQNEQKILEELSHLFKDHLDLLADFRSIVRR